MRRFPAANVQRNQDRAKRHRIVLDRRQFLAVSILLPMLRKRRTPSLYAKLERPPIPNGMPLGFGLGIPWQNEDFHPGWTERSLRTFKPPWWYNWKYDAIDEPGYVPMLWHPARDARFDESVQLAAGHPTKMWLLSHEPDRGNGVIMDPAGEARIAREWVASTSALFAAPGTLSNGNGVDWLKAYLDAGAPVPDAWHIHIYAEKDGAAWRASLEDRFAEWYLAEGQGRPIIISETSASGQESWHQISLMAEAAAFLRERSPIVSVGWSADRHAYDIWPWTNLIREDGTLTDAGRYYLRLYKGPLD